MDYKSTQLLSKVQQIKEFNIRHYIIGESVLYGVNKVIKTFKKILKKKK